jgi:exo-beta-1,3-glucanase (GH17 family)
MLAPPRRIAVLLGSLAIILAAAFFSAWQRGRPIDLPAAKTGQLPCVSYAPFRRPADTPFNEDLHISRASIEADLRLLATVTGCIRTYGIDHGLDAVPAVARDLGLKVVLGAWIGNDPAANARQLQQALALARDYRDVVKLLMVGNEVLLRGDLAPEALAALLATAGRESSVPVSYADVWAFWQRHKATLLPHVDVVSAHILPYWEDKPVGSDTAVTYVHRLAAELRTEFAPLPLFVAETGWPAAGRQRGPAAPGRLEQARFVRGLLAQQDAIPIDFNLIEGFDQPWKRRLEGAMGGAWGLFAADGTQRVPLKGPLPADPYWAWPPGAALLAAIALWLVWQRTGRPVTPTTGTTLVVGGGLIGTFCMQQALLVPVWSRDLWEWLRESSMLLLCVSSGVVAAWQLAELLADCRKNQLIERMLPAVLPVVLLAVTVLQAFLLVIDGRYRPLPWQGIAAPAILLAALATLGASRTVDHPVVHRLIQGLAFTGLGCALLIVLNEGLANDEALRYTGLLALLALPAFCNRANHHTGP